MNMPPNYKWDVNAILQRYEHGINSSAKGNEYKTISINTGGPREGHKTQRGPQGGHSKSGCPEGANKRGL